VYLVVCCKRYTIQSFFKQVCLNTSSNFLFLATQQLQHTINVGELLFLLCAVSIMPHRTNMKLCMIARSHYFDQSAFGSIFSETTHRNSIIFGILPKHQ